MAKFTTRVELHVASERDYETLHKSMKLEGFSRVVVSSDGTQYQLPNAEYDRIGPLTTEQVLDSARRAAMQTGRAAGILVSEVVSRRWIGLQKSSQKPPDALAQLILRNAAR